ncbi:hypothetical protein J6590_063533 [Homalodisca vitripennis]|nr:hypothetical protein J6590_063533 [Homalodisca vitripennis]
MIETLKIRRCSQSADIPLDQEILMARPFKQAVYRTPGLATGIQSSQEKDLKLLLKKIFYQTIDERLQDSRLCRHRLLCRSGRQPRGWSGEFWRVVIQTIDSGERSTGGIVEGHRSCVRRVVRAFVSRMCGRDRPAAAPNVKTMEIKIKPSPQQVSVARLEWHAHPPLTCPIRHGLPEQTH